MLYRALVVWLVFMFIAILNGALREGVLNSRLGEASGQVASTLLLSALIMAVAFITVSWLKPATPAQAATVAALWVLLTVTFEFGFGHFVAGKPWTFLLADYNVLQGRLWLLVPVTVAAAPYLTARLRGLF